MVIYIINLLESFLSLINENIKIVNEWDITLMICGILHDWLYAQLRYITMVSTY